MEASTFAIPGLTMHVILPALSLFFCLPCYCWPLPNWSCTLLIRADVDKAMSLSSQFTHSTFWSRLVLCSISSGIILGEIDHFSVLPSQSSAQRAILPSIKPDRKRAAKWSARRRGRGRSGRNYDMDGMTTLRVIADVTFAKIDFNFLQQNVDNIRRNWNK